MKKLFVVAALLVCAVMAYAQGASQALPVYVYRGSSILPTKTTIDLGDLAHPFDSVYAESGIFAIMFIDSMDVSVFLADSFDLGTGSFEEIWGTHFEADSAWIEYLGGGSPITLLDSLIGGYIQSDISKAVDELITQGSRAGACSLFTVDHNVALDEYTLVSDTTDDINFTLPALSAAWDTTAGVGLEYSFYNQGAGILAILQHADDTLSLGGQDSMHVAQYSGLRIQAASDSLWAIFAGGGGSGYDPDSLWFYRAYGDSLRINEDGAMTFWGWKDSLEVFALYPIGAGAVTIPTQDTNYFNIFTGMTDVLLTSISLAAINPSGGSLDFYLRVYDAPDLGGSIIAQDTVTLVQASYAQDLYLAVDTLIIPTGSFSVHLDCEAFRSYTVAADSSNGQGEIFSYPMGGPWTLIPDLSPFGAVYGGYSNSYPAEVASLTASDSTGVETTQMSADTLAIGPVVLSCPMGDSILYVDGVPTLTDTCWTSSGDMLVVVNGHITNFVPTP